MIEILIVMIVIGLLAAIAIPRFLNQRAKAYDSSTKADVSVLGKEVASYFVDRTGTLVLDFTTTPGRVLMSDGSWTNSVRLTSGTVAPTSGGSAALGSATAWCVALTDAAGSKKDFSYSAAGGLAAGTC